MERKKASPGLAVQVKLPGMDRAHPAALLEVKRLAVGPSGNQQPLMAFISWKERNEKERGNEALATFKRRNLWVEATRVVDCDIDDIMVTNYASAPVRSTSSATANTTLSDFFEDRLRRDMNSATTIFNFHYLGFIFRSWFFAPWHLLQPEGSYAISSSVLHDAYLDPFSLQVFPTADQMIEHVSTYCTRFSPPGQVIYADEVNGISVYAVDGARHRSYCRQLFLLGKSFLDNKLAGHDVGMYMFYVVCLHESALKTGFVAQRNARYFASFFSWEKGADSQNLACIVALPCFQGRGLGTFMIALSYELSYRRGAIGSPERPLSDLGSMAYQSFWRSRILDWAYAFLLEGEPDGEVPNPSAQSSQGQSGSQDENLSAATTSDYRFVSIQSVAEATRLDEADVAETVLGMGLLHRSGESEGGGFKMLVPLALVRRNRQERERPKPGRFVFYPERLHVGGGAAGSAGAAHVK